MTITGLRELRQQASELVRQAEAGEVITVTVSGRPAALLGPIDQSPWRRWSDIEDIFTLPPDQDWAADRDLIDQGLRDPDA